MKHKNFLYIRKKKRKSNPHPKSESWSNPHLAVPANTSTSEGRTLERHSKVTVLSLKQEKEEWRF